MKNKKGQTLSINTVIITILAIFVLVLIVVALTGGFGNFVDWWNNVFTGSGIDSQKAALQCNGFCESYQTTGSVQFAKKYCTKEFNIDSDGDNKGDITLMCPDIVTVSCSVIDDYESDVGEIGCEAFS